MQNVIVRNLGLISYKEAWDYQDKLFRKTIDLKIKNRNLPEADHLETKSYLLFCEHPHVITLGKSGQDQNLLMSEDYLKSRGVEFFRINRGGDITYHGPGQIVAYPILDLDNFFTDIHKFMRFLEEIIIRTLSEYDVIAGRLKGATGVWLNPEDPVKARKICAMGIRCSRWVTMHGLAFNINTDLDFFGMIIPCGLTGKKVTSLSRELGRELNIEEVRAKMKRHFSTIFNARLTFEDSVNSAG